MRENFVNHFLAVVETVFGAHVVMKLTFCNGKLSNGNPFCLINWDTRVLNYKMSYGFNENRHLFFNSNLFTYK